MSTDTQAALDIIANARRALDGAEDHLRHGGLTAAHVAAGVAVDEATALRNEVHSLLQALRHQPVSPR